MSRFMQIGDSFIRPETIRCIRVARAVPGTSYSAGHPDRVLVHHSEERPKSILGSLGDFGAGEHIEVVPCESYEEAADLAKQYRDRIEGCASPAVFAGSEVAS